MIAVITFIAAMVVFAGGLAAVASGCRNEFQRRSEATADEDPGLMAEIEEWLKQQQ